jgi:hypothetical protein
MPEQQSSWPTHAAPLGWQVLEPSLHVVTNVPEQLRPAQQA